jgi:hypothetical protein
VVAAALLQKCPMLQKSAFCRKSFSVVKNLINKLKTHKKKCKQGKRWVRMSTVLNHQDISVFCAARSAYSPFLSVLPKQVGPRQDLRHVGYVKGWSREGRINKIYSATCELLSNLDARIAEVLKDLEGEGVPQVRNKMLGLVRDLPELRRSFLIWKDVLPWVNDVYLLSTFLFHLRLADTFLTSIDVEKAKDASDQIVASTLEKMLGPEGDREYTKAIVVLALAPLFIWAALIAKSKGDYRFILHYEKTVSRAGRVIATARPDMAQKMSEIGEGNSLL